MEYDAQSSEFDYLERLLARGPAPVPSPAWRGRVLGEVTRELHRAKRRPRQRFLLAAAAVLLWLVPSVVATRAIGAALSHDDARGPVGALARRIQRLSPEISPEESVREAMLVQLASEFGLQTNLGNQLNDTQLCLNRGRSFPAAAGAIAVE